jgi:hypothetical protein
MKTGKENRFRVTAALEMAVAFGIVAFWTAFFTADLVGIEDGRLKDVYLAYESAFPPADLCLAGLLAAAGIALWRGKRSGALLSLLGGSCLVFLGLLDVSFNAQQGLYALGLSETVMNIGINGACLGLGTLLILKFAKTTVAARGGETGGDAGLGRAARKRP